MATLASALDWLGLGSGLRSTQDSARFNYSPDLIAKLTDDHAGLVKQYGEIERMAIEGRYVQIAAALAQFKSKFDLHILEENLRFYCYVEEQASSPSDQATVKAFRAEMNAIARTVVNFVKKYRMSGVRPSNGQEFIKELREVGKALVLRIQREEGELYTLYHP